MKKILYILSIALMALACTDVLERPVEPAVIDDNAEDGPKVTVEFSLPPMTKGLMAHNPTIGTIHVAVFNQAGVMKQYEKAILTNPENLTNGNNSAGNPKYSVEINMSAKPRILHFIADSPVETFDELVALAGTSGEDVILSALTTSGGATAYWQMVELDKVDAYKYQGGVYTTPDGINWGTTGGNSYQYTDAGQTITVYEGDYIKRDGHKILDGTGYFQSDYVKGKVANIPFIRNFAEITVSSTTSTNFIPKKFALVNVPKAGYVAPFDSKKGDFCSAYIGVDALTHSDVKQSAYPGTLAGSIDTELPASFIDLSAANPDAYMYERPIPNKSQPATCILVAGQYDMDADGDYTDNDGAVRDSDGNTWFKIELTNEDGSYYPIYRGISYNIKIGLIEGTSGYGSADDAYDNDPVGDISGSVTTSTLEQINDGKGTTLWVEYLDYVATETESKTIFYTMYYTDPNTGTITDYLYDDISITSASVTHPDESLKAITATPTVADGTFNSGTPDDTKTWKKATVTLDAPGTATKHSVLHIEGTAHSGKQMYRDVHYRVMGTQKFQNGNNVLTGTSLPTEDAGETTTLTIYLPNDLGMSMFPLTLRIEAENEGFTSVEGLPVESGPSLFNTSTSTRNAFYFLKTIDYKDYYNSATGSTTTAFTATFKTTRDGTKTAAGTNATNFRVLDKVKEGRDATYFEVAECYVSVGGPSFRLSSNSVSVKADVTSASFVILSTGTENTQWSLTPSTNITSLTANPAFTEGYSGSGNATITVNFPPNEDTEAKEYKVTASRTGFPNQEEFVITQQGVTRKYYTINLDAGGNNETYGYDWVSSEVNPGSNTYWSYQSNNARQANTIATMSVTVYGYTEFKIRIRNNAEANYDYIIVSTIGAGLLQSWNNRNNYSAKASSTANTTGTNLNNYTEVTFNSTDGLTEDGNPHTFYIVFGKDNSVNNGNDCAYVLIPKEYTFVSQ